jgi:hypothetical protein
MHDYLVWNPLTLSIYYQFLNFCQTKKESLETKSISNLLNPSEKYYKIFNVSNIIE